MSGERAADNRPEPGSVKLSAPDLAVDHQVAQLSTSFEFLTSLTPVNATEAKQEFLETNEVPTFEYPDLPVDPAVVREQLKGIDLAGVEDSVVSQLLAHKVRELELQADMLAARNSETFKHLSIELFGSISPRLRERAQALLDWVPDKPEQIEHVDAEQFLAMAREEVDYYRGLDPSLGMHAEITGDAAGVMVQEDTLLVPPTTNVEARRANALIQHEVGTHLVTRANGAAQPLKVMGAGLAGYDETQEGLAVLAEIACGGLTASRLRTLAARVITVHRMVDGVGFRDCFEALRSSGFGKNAAFTTTMRVFRSGGFTKDAVYLRGLTDLLDHVADGGSLELMWLGKFSLNDLSLVEDLWNRGILHAPRVRPHYLEDPHAQARIDHAAKCDTLSQIFQEGHQQ